MNTHLDILALEPLVFYGSYVVLGKSHLQLKVWHYCLQLETVALDREGDAEPIVWSPAELSLPPCCIEVESRAFDKAVSIFSSLMPPDL